MVMCGACRARYAGVPPARSGGARSEVSAAVGEVASEAVGELASAGSVRGVGEGEDRVRRVVRELPRGEHSTARIARAAGLNHEKTVRRLRRLAELGEIRQVGKRWSTERDPSDLDQALERLQARTSNIRFVRDGSLVG